MATAVQYARAFWEAGLHVFPLNGFTGKQCGCGDERCQAAGKHPRAKNWQHTPLWDDEQMDNIEEAGWFSSGYGVLCKGLLVIDVDVRNGGEESYARLVAAVPEIASAGLIVRSGRGDGGRHLYFSLPEAVPMVQHLSEYRGIDFKSSGFTVGPGSRHVAGGVYQAAVGGPEDIEPAPQALIDLLRKPERHRTDYEGRSIDVSHADIAEMLTCIKNDDLDYEIWIRIGMAIHHATQGTGYSLWLDWSATSPKHDDAHMETKWHSFGRGSSMATIGTIIHYAAQGGWIMPVTFGGDTPQITFEEPEDSPKLERFAFDPMRPPGAMADIVAHIASRQRRSLKNAALGTALWVSSCIFASYTDDLDGVTPNLITFIVAGSGAGKESTQAAGAELVRIAGYAPSIHGTIKSEKEIVENLLRHQCAHYQIDEVGSLLVKIRNAQKRGGAAHHEGTIGMIMSAFSKGNSFLLIGGDRKEEARQTLMKEMSGLQKKLDDGAAPDWVNRKLESVHRQLASIDNGIERPYLTINGFATPQEFDQLMDYETATNGFMRRALIFHDHDTAPPTKDDYKFLPVPEVLAQTIKMLGTAGTYDSVASSRIELPQNRRIIPSTTEARQALRESRKAFDALAIQHKGQTGLEALFMGAYELVSKVSLILGAWGGLREIEHVRWSHAMVLRDVERKAMAVTANDRAKDSPKKALQARIAGLCGSDEGETASVIKQRCRGFREDDVQSALERMVADGILEMIEKEAKGAKGGRPSRRYRMI